MKTEHTKTTITGKLTNDAWGGDSSGHYDTRYIHCSETHETHDLIDTFNELKGKKVKITIETID